MNKTTILKALMTLGICSWSAIASAVPMKNVTVQNLSRGQILSPPVVIVHKPGYLVFEAGKPASKDVALLAEDGTTTGFKNLEASPEVHKVFIFPSGIQPGKSKTMLIQVPLGYRISLLSMLVTTNDAFAGLQNKVVPRAGYKKTYLTPAYDSGSEANTESCAHIPGPPCDAHDVRAIEGSEGKIQMHPGIKGGGDLDARMFNWKGPVMKVKISTAD